MPEGRGRTHRVFRRCRFPSSVAEQGHCNHIVARLSATSVSIGWAQDTLISTAPLAIARKLRILPKSPAGAVMPAKGPAVGLMIWPVPEREDAVKDFRFRIQVAYGEIPEYQSKLVCGHSMLPSGQNIPICRVTGLHTADRPSALRVVDAVAGAVVARIFSAVESSVGLYPPGFPL